MIVRREVVASKVHLIYGTQCTTVNAIQMRPTRMSAVRIQSSMTSRPTRDGTRSRRRIKVLGGCEDLEDGRGPGFHSAFVDSEMCEVAVNGVALWTKYMWR